jgi:hypothetical protein
MTDEELDQRLRERVLSEDVNTSRVELAIRNQIRTNRRTVPGWGVAAAAVIAMVLAGEFSYRTFRKEQTPPVCAAAAQDHEREIVSGEPRPWLSNMSAIESLAAKQGVPASAVTALNTTGYRLERARLCFLNKQIYLHLVYTRDGGEFSVYLRPRGGEPRGNSVHQVDLGPDNLAYFQMHGLTAVFVSQHSGAAANVLAFARAGARALQGLPS